MEETEERDAETKEVQKEMEETYKAEWAQDRQQLYCTLYILKVDLCLQEVNRESGVRKIPECDLLFGPSQHAVHRASWYYCRQQTF